VSFDVTNVGPRPGADVPQIYVTPAAAPVPRPKRELEAFTRVELFPGETRRVSLPLGARAFTYFDTQTNRWRAPAGSYGVELARSAEDVEARAEVRLTEALDVDVRD
jgi:hypothetical protein